MGTDTIEASFLSIFALISFFVFLITSKYSKKIKNGALFDNDLEKPQSFHDTPVTRSGGLAALISLIIFYSIYFLLYSKILYNYILISYAMFFTGFLDDLKINIKPSKRLMIMIILLFSIIYFLPIKIFNVDIPFLRNLLNINIFHHFVLLCFLFIINGANLIDGFNGLLVINLILINIILTLINVNGRYLEFSFILISQIIILLSFLLFNFPNAKMFFGDKRGLFDGVIGWIKFNHNNLNPKYFFLFFCTLLFLSFFFEVFFSFFERVLQRQSPIHPDKNHLYVKLLQNFCNLWKK